MRRRMLAACALLAATLILGVAAPVSAAPKVHYSVLENSCTSSKVYLQLKIIKDAGVGGIDKLTMDGKWQQFKGGAWKTGQKFSQVSKHASSGAKVTFTYGFGLYGPFPTKVRLVVKMRAWSGNNVTWTQTRNSVVCGPS